MRITSTAVMRKVNAHKKIHKEKVRMKKKALYPDILSSGAKNFIEVKVIDYAINSNKGSGEAAIAPSTPEQAQQQINNAVQRVIQELQESVPSAVDEVLKNKMEGIMEKIYHGGDSTDSEPQLLEGLPPGDLPPEGSQNTPAGMGAPVAASHRIIDPKLKYAFMGLAQLTPQVDHGIWVTLDGPAGEEAIKVDDVNMDELEYLMSKIDAGEQVSLEGTSLDGLASNSAGIWYLDVSPGYGANIEHADEKTPWKVFEEKTDAWDYLNEIASTLVKSSLRR